MAIDRSVFEKMRDCVKVAFRDGCQRGLEFRKMRHAIIVELKRLGLTAADIKDVLPEWNERCEKQLSLSEIKSQLFGYVDWVFKQECREGCKGLRDYCIGKESCQYLLKTTSRNRRNTAELPFSIDDLDSYLTQRFKGDGYGMMLVVKALRFHQIDKATGEIILVGYRTLSSIVRDKQGHSIYPMSILRKMRLLIEEGVVEQVVKGKGGTFSHQANGYRFLAWRPPTSPTPTHINSMCNKNKYGDT